MHLEVQLREVEEVAFLCLVVVVVELLLKEMLIFDL